MKGNGFRAPRTRKALPPVRIKLKRPMGYIDGKRYDKGEEFDCQSAIAAMLIKAGNADPVEKPEKK